jgi:hypothetical protein
VWVIVKTRKENKQQTHRNKAQQIEGTPRKFNITHVLSVGHYKLTNEVPKAANIQLLCFNEEDTPQADLFQYCACRKRVNLIHNARMANENRSVNQPTPRSMIISVCV